MGVCTSAEKFGAGEHPGAHRLRWRYASSAAAPVSIARPRAVSRAFQPVSVASRGSSPPAERTWAMSGAICSRR
jgi:hypothetical protein